MSHPDGLDGRRRGAIACQVATTRPSPGKTTASSPARARSTIALKMLMAVSGVVFIVFVLVHMYGNLKAFTGHDAYNEYAEHLRAIGEPMLPHEGMLWVIRVGPDRARWSCT